MDYDKKLTGALFKNDKGDNPKRPDYKGVYTDGQDQEFVVSAWVKTSKDGKQFMSFSMQPKESKPVNQAADNSFAQSGSDNSLPF